MIELERKLRIGKFQAVIIGQVHDSLVIDAPKKEVRTVAALMKKVMEKVNWKKYYVGGLKNENLPLSVDVKIGPHF